MSYKTATDSEGEGAIADCGRVSDYGTRGGNESKGHGALDIGKKPLAQITANMASVNDSAEATAMSSKALIGIGRSGANGQGAPPGATIQAASYAVSNSAPVHVTTLSTSTGSVPASTHLAPGPYSPTRTITSPASATTTATSTHCRRVTNPRSSSRYIDEHLGQRTSSSGCGNDSRSDWNGGTGSPSTLRFAVSQADREATVALRRVEWCGWCCMAVLTVGVKRLRFLLGLGVGGVDQVVRDATI
ncbi:hypothetical protein HDV00_001597 [Rhizophlyctis rosea]|nr:hypothetical protein HDV00_001597 [Rhizophlyctis rosea]